VTRHAWLTLADNERDLADGQLHCPQEVDNPHARRIGKSAEKVELAGHKRVICSLVYPGQMARLSLTT
jgi:hypothetical protein